MKYLLPFKIKAVHALIFILFLNFSSCCVFSTDPPDLRLTSQNFPSQVTAGQRFDLTFTVGNYSNTDCNAETTSQSIVNLKMIKQSNNFLQVNNTETLNALENDQTQIFNFSVLIEGENVTGAYNLIFTIDPNNTSGDAYRDNNVYTATITVN
ncbi:MAG: hypothetical protein JNJ56_04125 [Ignavibacteria bacterium]|nr:hypothetical protein [Ignavibacteria bacterium]